MGFAEDEVYGMRSKKDNSGIYYGEYEDNYPPTQNEGKSKLISQFLVPKFGKGPSFVAGDSKTNSFMMKDFDNTELCLIIDRNLDGNIAVLKNEIGDKYIVQGRNEFEGKFINNQNKHRIITWHRYSKNDRINLEMRDTRRLKSKTTLYVDGFYR